jgi:hypothetical protein
MRSTTRNLVAGAAVALGLTLGGAAEASAGWKVVHWNVQSGFGKGGWVSTYMGFRPGPDCATNAWGNGYGPLAKTLVAQAKNDPDVVAVTLNEAWTCATPRRIQALLGFAAVALNNTTGDVGGVSIVARYGFAGPAEVKALPKCSSTTGQYWLVYAPVYIDAAKTKVAHIYSTHWNGGCAAEGEATAEFMQRRAWKPRALTGDLNSKTASAPGIVALNNRNYRDVWAALRGGEIGSTSTWNSVYGSPKGNLYKRIDYAFAKTLTPLSITLFNTAGQPGAAKQADHAGIKVEYAR